MIINAVTAGVFFWLCKEIGGEISVIDKGLFWISRPSLLGCLLLPIIAYVGMKNGGESINMEIFITTALTFWVGGIIGALAINNSFFGQTSIWATKNDESTDLSY